MKHIILFLTAAFLTISVYSQTATNYSNQQNSSFLTQKQNTPEVKIYPNPCKNSRVNVEFKSHLISEIQLTNIAGKVVLKKKFDFAEMKKQVQLNDIQNGMYLLQVKSTDNKKVVKKFIVSK
jgi:hypothetical protein